jgi:hypothetical protein
MSYEVSALLITLKKRNKIRVTTSPKQLIQQFIQVIINFVNAV